MQTLDFNTTQKVYDRRSLLIERANEQHFLVEVGNKRYKGKIAGSRLDFPVVSANGGLIHYEISWALVERIAHKNVEVIHV